jgi:hypothetical protein
VSAKNPNWYILIFNTINFALSLFLFYYVAIIQHSLETFGASPFAILLSYIYLKHYRLISRGKNGAFDSVAYCLSVTQKIQSNKKLISAYL